MSIKDTRENLADIINRVSVAGDIVVVTKFGKPKAMIVPISENSAIDATIDESFGIWNKRKDIKDSALWVEKLRQTMSTRNG